MKLKGTSIVSTQIVVNRMGKLIRTENSLNQHTRLKHSEYWEELRRKKMTTKETEKKEEEDN